LDHEQIATHLVVLVCAMLFKKPDAMIKNTQSPSSAVYDCGSQ